MDCPYIAVLKKDDREFFLNMHKKFLLEEINSKSKVVFLGDSITQFFDKIIFERYFNKYNALNFGIYGDKTEHVIFRIENGMFDFLKPTVIVLLIGVNNYNCTHIDTSKGILEIINKILKKTPNTKILLLGLLPFSNNIDGFERNYVKSVNNIIKNYNNNKNIFYLDIGSKFIKNYIIDYEIMPDYLHLSSKGYEIFASSIANIIENLVKLK
jgi:N-acetylglucosamine-6-sulfatase